MKRIKFTFDYELDVETDDEAKALGVELLFESVALSDPDDLEVNIEISEVDRHDTKRSGFDTDPT